MKTIRDSGQSDPSNGRGDRAHSALPEIPAEFLQEEFYRPASGPGGQHVNRTETGVRLRFFFRNCPVLSEGWKRRLAEAARRGNHCYSFPEFAFFEAEPGRSVPASSSASSSNPAGPGAETSDEAHESLEGTAAGLQVPAVRAEAVEIRRFGRVSGKGNKARSLHEC